MNSSSRTKPLTLSVCFLLFASACPSIDYAAQAAGAGGVRFQRPGTSTDEQSQQQFRRPGTQPQQAPKKLRLGDSAPAAPSAKSVHNPLRERQPAKKKVAKKNIAIAKTIKPVRRNPVQAPAEVHRDGRVSLASDDSVRYETDLSASLQLTGRACANCPGDCTCDASCGITDPSCGIMDSGYGMAGPGCGCPEAVCGCPEPYCGCPGASCGIIEPGCGCADPNCGGGVGCGSCVGRPGPDYWCFPVCLPRFKDFSAWGGVQGFRGPRDFIPAGQSNSNFGFHEGFNLSGRAPLLGLLFPQLSSQMGYQAVQSRLHGTLTSAEDRSQQFVTAGIFRRVNTGLQFGVVWDLLSDDLGTNIDLQQIRSEFSLKSPRGHEIGFWSAASTNSSMSGGVTYETVNQYAAFYRRNFGNSCEARFWGGGTDDSEAIVGAEFSAPLSDRWSVRSAFNYLITDNANGPAAVQEESWNIGISMVWHLGRNARSGCRSPFRPLFSVADNGWMFVDRQ